MPELNSKRPTYTVDFIPGDTRNSVFLGNPLLDGMVTSLLALGAEVWAGKRRLKVIESLMAAKREVTPAAIEAYVPTPEEERAWEAERDQLVKLFFGSLLIKGDTPPDFIPAPNVAKESR
jgi:hypothetical protein